MTTRPTARRGAAARAHLEVRDLRLVTAVAAEGSLTRAVDRLNVTQPALSRHLASLESRLGTRLFSREGSRLRVTPAGELFLRRATELLDGIEQMEADLSVLADTPRRVLRIGTECYTGYHWLPPVLARFSARHPTVEVEIAYEAARRPIHLLRAGAIDVALLTDGPQRGVACIPLFDDENVAVVAPNHPWAARSHVEPADFIGTRVLLLSAPAHSLFMNAFLKPAGIKPKQVADVQLVGAVASLVESGFGIGIVPNWTVSPEVKSGRLVAVRLGRGGAKRHWLAAVTKTRSRDRLIRDFIEALATGGGMHDS